MLAVPDENDVFQFVIFGDLPMGNRRMYVCSKRHTGMPTYLPPNLLMAAAGLVQGWNRTAE